MIRQVTCGSFARFWTHLKCASVQFGLVAVAAVLACLLVTTGCAGHARIHYVSYDYFTWNSQEAIVYSQWEHDNHREHVDFTELSNTGQNVLREKCVIREEDRSVRTSFCGHLASGNDSFSVLRLAPLNSL